MKQNIKLFEEFEDIDIERLIDLGLADPIIWVLTKVRDRLVNDGYSPSDIITVTTSFFSIHRPNAEDLDRVLVGCTMERDFSILTIGGKMVLPRVILKYGDYPNVSELVDAVYDNTVSHYKQLLSKEGTYGRAVKLPKQVDESIDDLLNLAELGLASIPQVILEILKEKLIENGYTATDVMVTEDTTFLRITVNLATKCLVGLPHEHNEFVVVDMDETDHTKNVHVKVGEIQETVDWLYAAIEELNLKDRIINTVTESNNPDLSELAELGLVDKNQLIIDQIRNIAIDAGLNVSEIGFGQKSVFVNIILETEERFSIGIANNYDYVVIIFHGKTSAFSEEVEISTVGKTVVETYNALIKLIVTSSSLGNTVSNIQESRYIDQTDIELIDLGLADKTVIILSKIREMLSDYASDITKIAVHKDKVSYFMVQKSVSEYITIAKFANSNKFEIIVNAPSSVQVSPVPDYDDIDITIDNLASISKEMVEYLYHENESLDDDLVELGLADKYGSILAAIRGKLIGAGIEPTEITESPGNILSFEAFRYKDSKITIDVYPNIIPDTIVIQTAGKFTDSDFIAVDITETSTIDEVVDNVFNYVIILSAEINRVKDIRTYNLDINESVESDFNDEMLQLGLIDPNEYYSSFLISLIMILKNRGYTVDPKTYPMHGSTDSPYIKIRFGANWLLRVRHHRDTDQFELQLFDLQMTTIHSLGRIAYTTNNDTISALCNAIDQVRDTEIPKETDESLESDLAELGLISMKDLFLSELYDAIVAKGYERPVSKIGEFGRLTHSLYTLNRDEHIDLVIYRDTPSTMFLNYHQPPNGKFLPIPIFKLTEKTIPGYIKNVLEFIQELTGTTNESTISDIAGLVDLGLADQKTTVLGLVKSELESYVKPHLT